MRLIDNRIEADRGERKIKPGTRIVFLEQDPDFSAFATLMDFALAGADAPERHEVESLAGQLGLDMTTSAATASGGARRRAGKIGRASCRERVRPGGSIPGVAVSLKKNKTYIYGIQ